MRRERVGAIDDPVWSNPPPDAVLRGRSSIPRGVAGARLCAWSCAVVALSTTLPWYASWPQATGPNLAPEFTPLSAWLSPTPRSSFMVPGGQGWGFLILGASGGLAILAWVTATAIRRGPRPWLRSSVVALAAATPALLAVAVLESKARPSYGDSPLSGDWGAAVGIAAALMAIVGTWSALVRCGWQGPQSLRSDA